MVEGNNSVQKAQANFKRSVVNEIWYPDRACRNTDTKLFVSNNKKDAEKARAICQPCPVRIECLKFAIAETEVGVWGGTTETERPRVSGFLTSINKNAIHTQSPNAGHEEITIFKNKLENASPNKGTRRQRSPAEIKNIRSGISELKLIGFTDMQIAEAFGFSINYIKENVKVLIHNGVLEPRGKIKKAVEATDSQVIKLRKLGKTNKQIAIDLCISQTRVRESNSRSLMSGKTENRGHVKARRAKIDRQVLKARNQGQELTNREIAEQIGISYGTLKQSLQRLSEKGMLNKRRLGRGGKGKK